MKSLKIVITLSVLIILSSCGTAKWGNFNKQKFTKLKTIKVDKQDNISSLEETETYEVLNEANEDDKTPERILIEKPIEYEEEISLIEPDDTPEIKNPITDTINYALLYQYTFYVHVNGAYYYLKNQELSTDNILSGEMLNVKLAPENDNTIELNIGEYNLFQLNGLLANLDNVEIISAIPSPQMGETLMKETTQSYSKNNGTESTKPLNDIHRNKAKKRFIGAMIFLGIGLFSLLAAFTGIGLLVGVLGFFIAYILLITSAIESRRNSKLKEANNKQTSQSHKLITAFTWIFLTILSSFALFIPLLIAAIIIIIEGNKS